MAEQGALPSTIDCDVLIVGYGPVGMSTALLLADQGIGVVVVEKHPERYKMHRAGHFDGETFRMFQGLGIADDLELIASPVTSMAFMDANREVMAEKRSGESGAGWKPDYLLYQPLYEDIIDTKGRELGVNVFMGVTAEALTDDGAGVTTIVRPTGDADAAATIITSRYVIGADGPKSFVRDAIGSVRRDLGFKAMAQLVVDIEFHDPDIDIPTLPEAANVLDPARPTLSGRWGSRRWSRWEFAAMDGESVEYLESDETCWKLLAPWGVFPEHGTIQRHTVFHFESSLAEPWHTGRVFLAGDAAHTAPPYLGQGLLSGLRDGANLAWKIAAVLDGRADERLLATYEVERTPHVATLIETSSAQGKMVLMTDPELAAARDARLRAGTPANRPFPRLTTGLVRSPDAPGAMDERHCDGRPSLQARVARVKEVARLDDLLPRRTWRVVSRHVVPMEQFDERQSALIESLGMVFAHVSRGAHLDTSFWDIDAEYDRWYLDTGQKAFIERPDHYVYGTCTTIEDLPALLDELGRDLAAAGWVGAEAYPAVGAEVGA